MASGRGGCLTTVAVLHPGLDATIYNLVALAWFLSFVVEIAIIRSGGQRSTTFRADRGSGLFILLSIFVAITVANAIAGAGIGLLPKASFYLGIIMMLSGIGFRLWAVSTLRTFFSYTVQIKKEHHVIESGPYRFVRHPAYAGSLLTIVGVGFALQSWVAVLVMATVFVVFFGYRIGVEENVLVSSLGEEYVLYSKRVKRLIPYVF
jgi:protein-S-isoprenylcysteine O-methyltransferase Ste14